MAVPGPITLDSLVPGVSSLTANYTQTNPAESDRLYIQWRETGSIEWLTYEIFDETTFTIWGLDANTQYDVRIRAINDVDGFGPWSNTLSAATTNDSMGEPAVSWDEKGTYNDAVDGPQRLNSGTNGSNYDLTTGFGNTGSLLVAERNGMPVLEFSNETGIQVTAPPPTPAVSQACSIYLACNFFFVDGTARWVLHGTNIELRYRNDGFILTENSNGIYAVGGALSNDGRLYVVEAIVNGASSSLRVLDDQGADSGVVTGDIQTTGAIQPQEMGYLTSLPAFAGMSGGIFETAIYNGVGTAGERAARIQELLQKWTLGEPDRIGYTTGEGDASLPIETEGDGVTGVPGAGVARMGFEAEGAGMVSIGGVGDVALGFQAIGTGTVEAVRPTPERADPIPVDFNDVYELLLPDSEATGL